MSFLAPDTPDVGNNRSRQSFDPGGPLPVTWGWNKVTVKWCDTPWNVQSHYHGNTRPRSKSAHMVGLLCAGPIDAVYGRFLVNSRESAYLHNPDGWPLVTRQSAGGYFRGGNFWWNRFQNMPFRIYWGLPDQPRDQWLIDEGHDHPTYAGICYIVIQNLQYDIGGTGHAEGNGSPPNMEFMVYRASQLGGSATGDAPTDGNLVGVNPIGPIYDTLTNPIWGAGMPASVVPQSTWQDHWDSLQTHGYHWFNDDWGLDMLYADTHPAQSESKTVRDHLVDMAKAHDGFFALNPAGQLTHDWYPNRALAALPANTPDIDREDCLDEPVIEAQKVEPSDKIDIEWGPFKPWSGGSDNGVGEAAGTFRRPETYTARSPALRIGADGEVRSTQVKAPWITRRYAAHAYAQRTLRRKAETQPRIEIEVPRARAIMTDGVPIRPGDRVWFDHAAHGTRILMRCIARADRPGASTRLTLDPEPLFAADEITEPEDPMTPPPPPPPDPVDTAIIWQVPPALVPEREFRMAPLIVPGDDNTSWVDVYYFGDDDTGAEDLEMERVEAFASKVTITDFIFPLSGPQIELTVSDTHIFPGISSTVRERENDTTLLFIPATGHIISLGAVKDVDQSTPGETVWTYDFIQASGNQSGSIFVGNAPTTPLTGIVIQRENLVFYDQPPSIRNPAAGENSGYWHVVPSAFFTAGDGVTIDPVDLRNLLSPTGARITNADSGGYDPTSPNAIPGYLYPANATMVANSDPAASKYPQLVDQTELVLEWNNTPNRFTPEKIVINLYFSPGGVDQEDFWITREIEGTAEGTTIELPQAGWYWLVVKSKYGPAVSIPAESAQTWFYTDSGSISDLDARVTALENP